jgi:hypothetical protein
MDLGQRLESVFVPEEADGHSVAPSVGRLK